MSLGNFREHQIQCKFPLSSLLWWGGLYNSMKLWAMMCRATQDGWWVIAKSSDKTWSTGERSGNTVQDSCLENPSGWKVKRWKVWNVKKIWHLKLSPTPTPTPGQKVSNMLLGKSRRRLLIAPVKMKCLGQSRDSTHLWMCLVVKIKNDAIKNNTA